MLQGDNQQVTENNKLYWLAGIVDGEGTIRISERQTNGKLKRYDRFTPEVTITNTNQNMIDEIIKIGKTFNFGVYVYKRKGTNRMRYDVIISGLKRVKSILTLIVDKLISKKKQAETLMSYVNMRLEWLKKDQTNRHNIDEQYKEELNKLNDFDGYEIIAGTSTTIRGSSYST